MPHSHHEMRYEAWSKMYLRSTNLQRVAWRAGDARGVAAVAAEGCGERWGCRQFWRRAGAHLHHAAIGRFICSSQKSAPLLNGAAQCFRSALMAAASCICSCAESFSSSSGAGWTFDDRLLSLDDRRPRFGSCPSPILEPVAPPTAQRVSGRRATNAAGGRSQRLNQKLWLHLLFLASLPRLVRLLAEIFRVLQSDDLAVRSSE